MRLIRLLFFPVLLVALLLGLWGSPVTAQSQGSRIYVHYDTGWGNRIAIRGSKAPLSWTTGQNATWTTGNVWVWQAPVGMGAFDFKPLRNDSTWSTGANFRVPAEGSQVHIYPFFGPARGTLVTIPNFNSPQLQNRRTLILYLPPSYNENLAKRYPVLYMHDGQNLFNAQTAFGGVEWRVDETLNQLIGAGTVRETIVVGLYNTSGRMSEYTPSADPTYGGGNANAYLDFIEDTVKPYIDGNYRTLPSASTTMLMGSSLGGLVSCYGGWTRPATFGGVGCMSSSFWWDGEEFTETVEDFTGPKPPVRVYVDAGGNNDGAADTNQFRDALVADGYQQGADLSYWYEPTGSHNEASWAARLHRPLQYLLPFSQEVSLP